jgi:hypothetical protein
MHELRRSEKMKRDELPLPPTHRRPLPPLPPPPLPPAATAFNFSTPQLRHNLSPLFLSGAHTHRPVNALFFMPGQSDLEVISRETCRVGQNAPALTGGSKGQHQEDDTRRIGGDGGDGDHRPLALLTNASAAAGGGGDDGSAGGSGGSAWAPPGLTPWGTVLAIADTPEEKGEDLVSSN